MEKDGGSNDFVSNDEGRSHEGASMKLAGNRITLRVDFVHDDSLALLDRIGRGGALECPQAATAKLVRHQAIGGFPDEFSGRGIAPKIGTVDAKELARALAELMDQGCRRRATGSRFREL